jgi:hypothetical protein
MLIARRTSAALVAALLSLLVAAATTVPAAFAGAPATVTVRVVGPPPYYEALVPLTKVTTTETPVVKDGNPAHACSGGSAAGALELATAGDWNGPWSTGFNQYEVETIKGVSYPFSTIYYWSFWLNDKPATTGVCEAQLNSGDSILFFRECFSEKGECSVAPSVLSLEVPSTAEVGRPVTVNVLSHPNAGGAPSPAVGATVSGGGVTSAPTDSAGRTTMTFSGDGTYALRATGSQEGSPAVPGEADVCVHEGNDGTCGTLAPQSTSFNQAPASSRVSQGAPYTGPYAVVAAVTGLREGLHYSRADAPRVLSGKVAAHAAVTSISLRLRRTYRGRCWAYSGTRERFVGVRCRRGSFFQIATGGDSFSYLLPSRLPPGRYVLDVQATDATGNHTALARGSSRIVFYVK